MRVPAAVANPERMKLPKSRLQGFPHRAEVVNLASSRIASMGPRGNLLAGLLLLALAAMEILTGQSLGRFGITADRPDDPKNFWLNVAISGTGGLFFVIRYFYLISAISK